MEVNWSLDWPDAIFLSGEDSDAELFIFQTGEQYSSSRKGVEKIDVHLLGFRKTATTKTWKKEVALDILKDKGLKPAHPRIVFAVGQTQHDLPKRLGRHYVSLVSLVPCIVRMGTNDVRMVSETWIADDCRESRLISANYLFQRFRWVAAVPINT
ncbi:MAG: hypothetical protein WAV15_01465 [Minisyncoccia bacterium]